MCGIYGCWPPNGEQITDAHLTRSASAFSENPKLMRASFNSVMSFASSFEPIE